MKGQHPQRLTDNMRIFTKEQMCSDPGFHQLDESRPGSRKGRCKRALGSTPVRLLRCVPSAPPTLLQVLGSERAEASGCLAFQKPAPLELLLPAPFPGPSSTLKHRPHWSCFLGLLYRHTQIPPGLELGAPRAPCPEGPWSSSVNLHFRPHLHEAARPRAPRSPSSFTATEAP